jgi:hypothetical protein
MEQSKKNIGELLRMITNDQTTEIYSIICEVTELNETERTVDVAPLNGDAEIFGVRLQSAISLNNGFVIFPKIGSVVIVTFLNKLTGYVSTFSEIDKIYIDSENEIIFNDGSNDGIVKVSPLVNKLNTIENNINQLKSLFSAWVPVPSDGGASLKTFVSAWFSAQISPTQQTEIENDKIKH